MIRLQGGPLDGQYATSFRLTPPTLGRFAVSPRGSLGDASVRLLGKVDAPLQIETVYAYVLLRDSGPMPVGGKVQPNAVYTWLYPQPHDCDMRDPTRWRHYARALPDATIAAAVKAAGVVAIQQARSTTGGAR